MTVLVRAKFVGLSVLSGDGGVLLAFAWYERYWLWQGCFNELGRCYEPVSKQVQVEQAGLV